MMTEWYAGFLDRYVSLTLRYGTTSPVTVWMEAEEARQVGKKLLAMASRIRTGHRKAPRQTPGTKPGQNLLSSV